MGKNKFVEFRQKIVENCSKIIVGKEKVIEKIAITFLCGGNVLLEDMPGTGKTMLLRAFAKTVGGEFKRIQFTPDIMPSDVKGINFYNMKTGEFELRKGPIFANFILADEINRATPLTQSSLLEAMAEGQVTIDGETYPMPDPFMVAATQNPIESHGTFPLPEAQLDRFFMKISLGYMTREEEFAVLAREDSKELLDKLLCVVAPGEIEELKAKRKEVSFKNAAADYLMDLVKQTRDRAEISVGASTRGAMALYAASQVAAAFAGRDYVLPEDIKELAPFVLAHRLTYRGILRPSEGVNIFVQLLNEVPVPTEEL